ncbi:MAG: cysteine desulfurase family protein [Vicinamibacterales bacterium]
MRIYLDHNATTPVSPQVADAMVGALTDGFGNPSSVHYFGQQAKTALDRARGAVSRLIGAEPPEVVFTSGGTESDNLAIRGIADVAEHQGRKHLVVSAIEHEAVLSTAKALERRGWEVTRLAVDAAGYVRPGDLEAALRPDTALVSVMHANNEIGTVQPIEALASIAHAHRVPFHTDAVQTVGKLSIRVADLGVDLLSLSAHKFHGPKGAGALWIKRGTRLFATQTGGKQERSRRAGTENVPGIVGLGVAAQLAVERLSHAADITARRDRLEQGILSAVADTVVNGGPGPRVPNTTNVSFAGVEAEALLIALDMEGIAVSTGAACSSGTLEPSHVLRAMGLTPHRVQSSLRFSLSHDTTDAEIDDVLRLLPSVVTRLRTLHRAGSRNGAA